jgi:hypothetical protein
MITIAGASNSAYDGTFVMTGLFNTTAGLSSDIGAATEFTYNDVAASGTASGTITATLDDQFNFAYESGRRQRDHFRRNDRNNQLR